MKGAQMLNVKNWTTQQINAEFTRLLDIASRQGFASDKQRAFFCALRAEWRKRQELYNN
jgi:hypothetical protein